MNEIVTKADLVQTIDSLDARLTVKLLGGVGAIVVAATGFLAFLIRIQ